MRWNYWRWELLELIKDPIIEQIKVLYDLGDDGSYEIIRRTVAIFEPLFLIGWSSKKMIDRMMDKGVKPLELGMAIIIALTRTNPIYLNGLDSSLRIKFLKENRMILRDWEKLERQNE